jgi:hypothetical protein
MIAALPPITTTLHCDLAKSRNSRAYRRFADTLASPLQLHAEGNNNSTVRRATQSPSTPAAPCSPGLTLPTHRSVPFTQTPSTTSTPSGGGLKPSTQGLLDTPSFFPPAPALAALCPPEFEQEVAASIAAANAQDDQLTSAILGTTAAAAHSANDSESMFSQERQDADFAQLIAAIQNASPSWVAGSASPGNAAKRYTVRNPVEAANALECVTRHLVAEREDLGRSVRECEAEFERMRKEMAALVERITNDKADFQRVSSQCMATVDQRRAHATAPHEDFVDLVVLCDSIAMNLGLSSSGTPPLVLAVAQQLSCSIHGTPAQKQGSGLSLPLVGYVPAVEALSGHADRVMTSVGEALRLCSHMTYLDQERRFELNASRVYSLAHGKRARGRSDDPTAIAVDCALEKASASFGCPNVRCPYRHMKPEYPLWLGTLSVLAALTTRAADSLHGTLAVRSLVSSFALLDPPSTVEAAAPASRSVLSAFVAYCSSHHSQVTSEGGRGQASTPHVDAAATAAIARRHDPRARLCARLAHYAEAHASAVGADSRAYAVAVQQGDLAAALAACLEPVAAYSSAAKSAAPLLLAFGTLRLFPNEHAVAIALSKFAQRMPHDDPAVDFSVLHAAAVRLAVDPSPDTAHRLLRIAEAAIARIADSISAAFCAASLRALDPAATEVDLEQAPLLDDGIAPLQRHLAVTIMFAAAALARYDAANILANSQEAFSERSVASKFLRKYTVAGNAPLSPVALANLTLVRVCLLLNRSLPVALPIAATSDVPFAMADEQSPLSTHAADHDEAATVVDEMLAWIDAGRQALGDVGASIAPQALRNVRSGAGTSQRREHLWLVLGRLRSSALALKLSLDLRRFHSINSVSTTATTQAAYEFALLRNSTAPMRETVDSWRVALAHLTRVGDRRAAKAANQAGTALAFDPVGSFGVFQALLRAGDWQVARFFAIAFTSAYGGQQFNSASPADLADGLLNRRDQPGDYCKLPSDEAAAVALLCAATLAGSDDAPVGTLLVPLLSNFYDELKACTSHTGITLAGALLRELCSLRFAVDASAVAALGALVRERLDALSAIDERAAGGMVPAYAGRLVGLAHAEMADLWLRPEALLPVAMRTGPSIAAARLAVLEAGLSTDCVHPCLAPLLAEVSGIPADSWLAGVVVP